MKILRKKAKAYDEAIRKAEALYKASEPMSGCNVILETLFPELKESEDEKIRKGLIKLVQHTENDELCCEYGHSKNDFLTWLEKQGEKSVKWNENTDGNKPQKNHSVLMKTTHGITEGEWKGNESWIQYRWSSSIKDSDVLFWIELSDIEKQGEQKPTDEEMKVILHTEYEKGRADAIAEIQKEWSEEDEKEYKYVLKFVDNILNNCGNKKDYEHCKRYYDWLKSLRPQNNWKPSDEQMKALNYVVNLMASSESPKENDYYYNVFNDLRKQLKKLKEEKV